MRIQVAAEAARVLRAASDSVADRAAPGDTEWWLVSAAEGDTRDEGGLITRQKRLLRWGAAIVAALTLTGTAGAYTLEGEHAGANYKIVVPDANWNETLVVLAHGYRDKADHPGEVDDGRDGLGLRGDRERSGRTGVRGGRDLLLGQRLGRQRVDP
jgi:hypothetical protein